PPRASRGGTPALPRARDARRRDPAELQGARQLVADAPRRARPQAGLPALLLPPDAPVRPPLRELLRDHRPEADRAADPRARAPGRGRPGAAQGGQGPHPKRAREAPGPLPEGGGEPPARGRADRDGAGGTAAPARPELRDARSPVDRGAARRARLLGGGDRA